MSGIGMDLRFAVRSWLRAPGPYFALATVALGVGVNAAMFSGA